MNYWQYQNENWVNYKNDKTALASQLISLRHVSGDTPGPKIATAADSAFIHHPFTICVVGAGGKTSLILELMQEYLALEKSVLVTTTTHMFLPKAPGRADQMTFSGSPGKSGQLTLSGSTGSADQMTFSNNPGKSGRLTFPDNPDITDQLTFLGTPVVPEIRQDGWLKCQAPSPDERNAASARKDIVLIEADGSRKLPLKVPGNHEPVIPGQTNLILAVYGLSALGKTISEICQRHELLEQAQSFFSVPKAVAPVTPYLMAHMMRHYYLEPLQKKYPEASIIPVWNQADTPALIDTARDIARECGWNTQFITAFEKF